MSHQAQGGAEMRQHPRCSIPPMYTLVRVRPEGHNKFKWVGHIYDVSETGMRLELDEVLPDGTRVDVRAMLPGERHITFNASGQIVRRHDDADEPGPVRMGLTFEQFPERADRKRLSEYISEYRKAA